MKKKVLKILAALLIFSICTSLFPSSVLAVPVGKNTDSDSPTLEDFYAGNATAEDIYGKLDETIVPEIIGYETAVAKNHVGRLYEDEGTDLNKIVFLNVDGSKTMYLFDFPVKYMDETGSIQDIRLEIADGTTESGKFQTAANDAVTRFPAKFTDGISLEGNDTEIRLVPVLTSANSGTATMSTNGMTANAVANATARRIDKNTIEYRYDNKTTVEYSLTYTGFKEDIVVSEYTGQTTYPFRLYTNGLALEEMDGSYYLVDDDGNIKATIGNIIIFTADERNNAFGDIVPTTIVENEEYLLNIVVDADYLADPNTIYPIRIDPTIEINYDNNGGSAIEDITISTNKNFSGSHDSLYVGRRSTEGIARALMRFPGLNVSNLAGATVTSATVLLRDLMCESDELAISCHVFTGNVWDANSATWSNVSPNSYVSTAMSANTMSWSIGKTHSPVHWYSFDISSAVQGWIDGNYTQSKGIIFKVNSTVENGSTIANRTFGSYNRASYQPALSITYESGSGSSFATAETIEFGDVKTVYTLISNEKRYFKFQPAVSGEYLFYSMLESGDPQIWLYNSNLSLIDDDDDSGSVLNFSLAVTLTAGNTYYLEVGHHSLNTGKYEVHILRDAEISNGTYRLRNIGTEYYLDIHGPNAQEYVHQWEYHTDIQMKWNFTRDSNGYYTIQSLYGDRKYMAISSTSVGIDNIVLISNITDYARWKVYKDADNRLYLEPKSCVGKTLYVPNDSMGTELQLVLTSTNKNDRNLWTVSSTTISEPHTHVYQYTNHGPLISHPHEEVKRCECGATQTSYNINLLCDICMADSDVVTNTVMELMAGAGVESGGGLLAPGFYAVECYVEYTNYFIRPTSMYTNFPKFATYASSVVSYANPPSNGPSVNAVSNLEVTYHSGNGSTMLTQNMQWDSKSDSYPAVTTIHTFSAIPSYTLCGATFSMMINLPFWHNMSVTTYFP